MPKSTSVTVSEIPLYLLPRAIAWQINRIGDSVYRISVKRTHWHHYNIAVRVKSLPKELAPGRMIRCVSPYEREQDNHFPVIHQDKGCAV